MTVEYCAGRPVAIRGQARAGLQVEKTGRTKTSTSIALPSEPADKISPSTRFRPRALCLHAGKNYDLVTMLDDIKSSPSKKTAVQRS